MTFNTIKGFKLEFDGPGDAVYASSEILSGKVVLELNRDTKVDTMKVLGRGVATAHWLENRSGGMNAVYNDYTSKISYFRKRQHLIRGNRENNTLELEGQDNPQPFVFTILHIN
eukprot:XP_014004848.1 PREDICTED: arrestin domain-containing protein 2-like [Salmo salar]